jgi:hypothetical protein
MNQPGTYKGLILEGEVVSLLYTTTDNQVQTLCRFDAESFHQLKEDVESLKDQVLPYDELQPFFSDPFEDLYKKSKIAFTVPEAEVRESKNRINKAMQHFRGLG